MRKVSFMLCVCLVSLVLLLCACQTSNGVHNENPTTTLPMQNAQEAPSEMNQTDNKATTSEWKAAYLEFIEKNNGAYTSFALVFVDNDDIPELYMSGVCEAEGDRICSYKNGTVVDAYMNRRGGGKYVAREGTVINKNGHMGRCYTTVYRLDENGFTQILSALSVEHYEHLGNEEYEITYEYSIEGQAASEEEYTAAINASFDHANALTFYESAVSYDAVKQQITNWE